MKYSKIVLDMLKKGVEGDVEDYYDYFLDLTAKLGEEEEFAESWLEENEEFFDLINSESMYYFYVEEDTTNKQLCIDFLTPYYKKATDLVN
ncbi:hypothetical protein IR073_00055 [Gemella sp. 19428wG2_WT2a]|nr:hypothetical protein [Gemella sp. 19428wG2_WT2a]TFU60368.1 hypothetical protein E4T67_00055 [Gemella sp. WT2a]